MLKVLNLYAGIGGNRKLWKDVEVTAVEIEPDIAKIYSDYFPEDTVVIGDAHEYLKKHFTEFDFIWSSPPCPTHSRFKFLNNLDKTEIEYPDMTLYQEIILLQTWFKGKYCVENVISYYDPLIPPQKSSSHYFWCNFLIPIKPDVKRGIRRQDHDFRAEATGYDLSGYNLSKIFEKKVLNNCTESEIGLSILNCARGIIDEETDKQLRLFYGVQDDNRNGKY